MILITLVVSQGYLSTNYINYSVFPRNVAWGNKVEDMHGITMTINDHKTGISRRRRRVHLPRHQKTPPNCHEFNNGIVPVRCSKKFDALTFWAILHCIHYLIALFSLICKVHDVSTKRKHIFTVLWLHKIKWFFRQTIFQQSTRDYFVVFGWFLQHSKSPNFLATKSSGFSFSEYILNIIHFGETHTAIFEDQVCVIYSKPFRMTCV